MIIDSSAVIALVLDEPEADRIQAALLGSERARLPAPAYVECCLVLGGRFGEAGVARLDAFLLQYRLAVITFNDAHARAARDAFLAFGKGRHPAALNFGDCMSYAVAKAEGLPLLFVGDDFRRTDLAPA